MRAMNSLSTVWSEMFLLIARPIIPPAIPPAIIKNNTGIGNVGTLFVTKLMSKLASCEKKIMVREFSDAIWVGMEKKKNKTTKLIGPPPMPKKEDITPKAQPMMALMHGD